MHDAESARTSDSTADLVVGNVGSLFLRAIDPYDKPDAIKYKRSGAWYSISHSRLYAVRLHILEGYGMTETSPVISVNRLGSVRLGSVGQPIPGVEVKIAEDGEILTRGPHTMKGYYRDPEATTETLSADGWLRTGDLGQLDADGFLSVIDRKKDLIKTSGGKYIAPQPIESRVVSNPYVSQAVVVGERRKFPALLIVPDFEVLGIGPASGVSSTETPPSSRAIPE